MRWIEAFLNIGLAVTGQVPDIDFPNDMLLGWNHEMLHVDRLSRTYSVRPENTVTERTPVTWKKLDSPIVLAGTCRDGFAIVTEKNLIKVTVAQVQTMKLPTLGADFEKYVWNETGADSKGNTFIALVRPGDTPHWLKLTLQADGNWKKDQTNAPTDGVNDRWKIESSTGKEGIRYKNGQVDSFLPFKELKDPFTTFSAISTTHPETDAIVVPASGGSYIIAYKKGNRSIYFYTASASYFNSVLGENGVLYRLENGKVRRIYPKSKVQGGGNY